jgi:hypothetical protein
MDYFNKQKKQNQPQEILDEIDDRVLNRTTDTQPFLKHKLRVEPIRYENTGSVRNCVSKPVGTKPQ